MMLLAAHFVILLNKATVRQHTINFLNIWIPETITVIVLKMEQFDFYSAVVALKDADRLANSVDPNQTALLRAV